MPCPHGVGDSSGIATYVRHLSFSTTGRQKPFIDGGLDLGRPTVFLSPLARVIRPTQVLVHSVGPGLHTTNVCVIDHAKGTNRGKNVAKSGPLSSLIPLTLYCICKSVIGAFQHLLPQIGLMINLDLLKKKKTHRTKKKKKKKKLKSQE